MSGQEKRTPEQIQADLARTREELARSVDELSTRLDPRVQLEETKANLRAPAGAGHASALARRPHVVVVGGGIAGLAAATGLAERGVAVEVLEREPWLGGRVASWSDPAE